MANSGPPWIQQTESIITVFNVPVPGNPATRKAWGAVGRYSGTDTSYQVVVTKTAPVDKVTELQDVSFTSSILAKTLWRVLVGTIEICVDKLIDAPLTLSFYGLPLAAATVVTIYAKSSDGSSINADGAITGVEVG